MRSNVLPQMPQLQVDIDINKAVVLGLAPADITDTLTGAWGGPTSMTLSIAIA